MRMFSSHRGPHCVRLKRRSAFGTLVVFNSTSWRVLPGLLVLLFASLTLSAQTTIFSENFSDDSGSSTTVLSGDQWTATETTSAASGTMSITSGAFRFTASGANTTYSCTWESDPITISGYTGITISSSSAGSGSVTNVLKRCYLSSFYHKPIRWSPRS